MNDRAPIQSKVMMHLDFALSGLRDCSSIFVITILPSRGYQKLVFSMYIALFSPRGWLICRLSVGLSSS